MAKTNKEQLTQKLLYLSGLSQKFVTAPFLFIKDILTQAARCSPTLEERELIGFGKSVKHVIASEKLNHRL